MSIRFATVEDIPAIIEIAREFHKITRFRDYDFVPEKLAAKLKALVEHSTGAYCFFIADDKHGQPIGGLIGCVETHIFSDRPVANLIHYDVHPDHRMSGAAVRLMHAFRKWAENRGAFELSVGVNSGTEIERTDSFLRKLGFTLTGGNYSLMLQPTKG